MSQSEEAGGSTPAVVAELLRTTSPSLIERWKRRVLDDPAVPVANRLPNPALVDHMPALLGELVLALEQRQHTSLTAEEIGRRVWHSPTSTEHATQRIESGYTLPAVLRELSHFRIATIDHLRGSGATVGSEALQLIHTAIDEAMTVAAIEVEKAVRGSLASSESNVSRAQASLRETQELLQSVIDRSPVVIYVKDREGRYTLANHRFAKIFDLSPEAIVGKTDAELFAGQSLTAVRANDEEVLTTNAPIEREESIETKDGHRVFLSCKFPLRDESGAPHAVGGISTDITERKEQETRQAHLLELRDRFMGILAHDLREPINAISMAGQLLLRHANVDEQSVSFIHRIVGGAGRMARMVSELLDYARGDLGEGIPIQRKAVDVTEVVATSLHELRTAHPSWPIELDLPPGIRATVDPDRFAQVLTNLIGNAVHHGAPERPIAVHLRERDDALELEVHSEGAPIPGELLPVIFQPFRSEPSSGGRRRTGLGLYIVERIAHAHGGDVRVTSSAEEGTTFTVRLPKDAHADAP